MDSQIVIAAIIVSVLPTAALCLGLATLILAAITKDLRKNQKEE